MPSHNVDRNHDGEISPSELSASTGITMQESREFLRAADTDEDGEVANSEFRSAVERLRDDDGGGDWLWIVLVTGFVVLLAVAAGRMLARRAAGRRRRQGVQRCEPTLVSTVERDQLELVERDGVELEPIQLALPPSLPSAASLPLSSV